MAFNVDGGQAPAGLPLGQMSDVGLGSSTDTEVDVSDTIDEEWGKDPIQKQLTLTFQGLTVRVDAADQALGETLLSHVDPRPWIQRLLGSGNPKRVR